MADDVTIPLQWLAYALGDLDAARMRRGRRQRPRIVAFHSQQAAEKAMKAALILAGIRPDRTHDLDELRNALPEGWRVKQRYTSLARLSDYAAERRYPDEAYPVTPIEAATAVRQAIAVVRSIREDFDRRGVSTATLEPR
jgi:HEPN domain-containing protein